MQKIYIHFKTNFFCIIVLKKLHAILSMQNFMDLYAEFLSTLKSCFFIKNYKKNEKKVKKNEKK
jgi:hypothetical protein